MMEHELKALYEPMPAGAEVVRLDAVRRIEARLTVETRTWALLEKRVAPGMMLALTWHVTAPVAPLPDGNGFSIEALTPGAMAELHARKVAESDGLFADRAGVLRRADHTTRAWFASFATAPDAAGEPLAPSVLLPELRRLTKDGVFTLAEVATFAEPAAIAKALRDAAIAEVERYVMGKGAAARARWLSAVALAKAVPGFGLDEALGGVDAFLETLAEQAEKTKPAALLALVDKVKEV